MRSSIGPVAVLEKRRRQSGGRHAGVSRRNTVDGTVLGRGAGQEWRPRVAAGRRTERQRHVFGVLETVGLHGKEVFARDAAHGFRRLVHRSDDFGGGHGRGPWQEGQGSRRVDAGWNDDDYNAYVHCFWRAGSDGRQRPVDQHTGVDAVSHGRRQKIWWPRSRQDHVRSHQRPAPVPTSYGLQIGKRSSHIRREFIQQTNGDVLLTFFRKPTNFVGITYLGRLKYHQLRLR